MKLTYPFEPDSQLYMEFLSVLWEINPAAELAFRVAVDTGYRVSDIIRMRVPKTPVIVLTEIKTHKVRAAMLSPQTFAIAKSVPGEWLFPGRSDGYHIHRDTIGNAIRAAARRMHLPPGCGMHSARKMYAITLYERTGSLEAVQLDLGHGKLDTTLRYIFIAKALGDDYAAATKHLGGKP